MPRGSALGALMEEDVGSTDTMRESAGISQSAVLRGRRVAAGWGRVVGTGEQPCGTSPIRSDLSPPTNWFGREKESPTRCIQRCWIDRTRAINHATAHAIVHRRRHRMRGRVHDNQWPQAFDRRQSRRTDRAGARKRPLQVCGGRR